VRRTRGLDAFLLLLLSGGVWLAWAHEVRAEPLKETPSAACQKHGSGAVAGQGMDAAQLMGRWRVVSARRHRGGLTSEAEAEGNIGKAVVISRDRLSLRDTVISRPRYEISCHPRLPEGEVPTPSERWSNFYGFGMGRPEIVALDVYDLSWKKDYPYIRFEIVDGEHGQELWEMFDGWLYRMERVAD